MTTPNDGQPSYAPGWYADVNAHGAERWFDGTAWTEHVRPAEIQTVPVATAATVATAAAAGGYAAPATGGYVAPATVGYAAPAVEAGAYATATAGLGTAGATTAGHGTAMTKRPWYKRKPIIIPVAIVGGIIVLSGIGSAIGGGGDNNTAADKPTTSQVPKAEKAPKEEVALIMVDVPGVVGMTGTEAQAALSALGFKVDVGGGDLSMPVTAQDVTAGAQAEEGSTVRLTLQEKPKLTLSQQNALRSAEQYLDFMPFSRAGLIQQLASEYGEGFTAEDAEFAVATLEQTGKVDWNAEAAEAAQSYLDMMSFSRDGLFEQLTSSYGAGFTPEQANAGLAAVGY